MADAGDTFGGLVRALRRRTGLTQEGIAHEMPRGRSPARVGTSSIPSASTRQPWVRRRSRRIDRNDPEIDDLLEVGIVPAPMMKASPPVGRVPGRRSDSPADGRAPVSEMTRDDGGIHAPPVQASANRRNAPAPSGTLARVTGSHTMQIYVRGLAQDQDWSP